MGLKVHPCPRRKCTPSSLRTNFASEAFVQKLNKSSFCFTTNYYGLGIYNLHRDQHLVSNVRDCLTVNLRPPIPGSYRTVWSDLKRPPDGRRNGPTDSQTRADSLYSPRRGPRGSLCPHPREYNSEESHIPGRPEPKTSHTLTRVFSDCDPRVTPNRVVSRHDLSATPDCTCLDVKRLKITPTVTRDL